MSVRDPILHSVPIAELRPTQMTVGYREVEAKRKRWREIGDDKEREAFLGSHMIPVLLGPKNRRYVIDHHHLALALHQEGVESVFTTVVADLHHLEKDAFWVVADHRAWTHPYDTEGVRRDVGDLPKSIAGLADDPFRSLAGELRRAGGFAKDNAPFSEFLWADFLRRNIKRKVIKDDFTDALKEALVLACTKEAAYLPGWCGPHGD
ncbi:chromosome partitioning protein ParB [Methylobacterium terricola]|uniref:Chromosome partitioning protein ParB n=1 Tax=Methylobacterium terricola TaxID=2583531 RepID=A0A5C4LLL3_9HYPH|nr:ParB-like protein [Methylobacterium terricola]TNC14136.1 chromosome partitioning protein ParB [Methylobacterium terricola]